MKKIWIIGAGNIAKEYAKVLISLNHEFLVIGRGEKSATLFEEEMLHPVIRGGIKSYMEGLSLSDYPSHVIVAVDIPQLTDTVSALVEKKIPYIMVEKPGALSLDELNKLKEKADKSNSLVLIAYNRRFFASVLETEKIIKEDQGLTSFHFEFTEWSKSVKALPRNPDVLKNWLFANSSHVIDLAFFIGGWPERISAYTSGELDWYKHAVFVGAGETVKKTLFSYCANWNAPGRWAVEFMTSKHRIYLKPMEEVQIQDINSIVIRKIEIDDKLDKEFKPGFFLQTKAFISNDFSRFCTLDEQLSHLETIYRVMDN